MKRPSSKALLTCAVGTALALGAIAGCAPQNAVEVQQEEAAAEKAQQDELGFVDRMYSNMEKRAEEYAPEIRTLADGTQIQRTPDEFADSGLSYFPGETISYNTFYLDGDNRGCGACHDDLAETLAQSDYTHIDLRSSLGIETTVEQCLFCHSSTANEAKGLGTVLHTIHKSVDDANCWSCHNATEDGAGLQLYDLVKHQMFRGVVKVPDVQGEFSFTQDKVVAPEDMFSFSYLVKPEDYERYGNEADGVELDQEMFDNWTITVQGEVKEPKTFKLTDLIAENESVTKIITEECGINPAGGALIGTAEVTGIPLRAIIGQVELNDGATVLFGSEPGANFTFSSGLSLDYLDDAYLVYEMNGEPLRWKDGYPCAIWTEGHGAAKFVKQLGDITVSNLPAENFEAYRLGGNRPNVGFGYLREGQIVKAGEPFTFEGYAHDTTNAITAVEFSLDGGETWTSYPTNGATNDKWVWWSFTFTPEQVGAYVLQVRAVDDQGFTTDSQREIMINAKQEVQA